MFKQHSHKETLGKKLPLLFTKSFRGPSEKKILLATTMACCDHWSDLCNPKPHLTTLSALADCELHWLCEVKEGTCTEMTRDGPMNEILMMFSGNSTPAAPQSTQGFKAWSDCGPWWGKSGVLFLRLFKGTTCSVYIQRNSDRAKVVKSVVKYPKNSIPLQKKIKD